MAYFNWITEFNWVVSFCVCSTIDLYSRYFIGSKKSNILSCIVFQCFFICNSLYLITYNQSIDDYIINLQYLYGYFLYDIVNLFIYYMRDKNVIFIIHHTISIILLRSILTTGLRDYYYPTVLCLIAEIQNPVLNLKEFIVNYPLIKKYNKLLLFIMYLIFRIILFPIYAILVIRESLIIPINFNLIYLFFVLYFASVNWFIQMKNKFQIKFY